MTLEHFAVAIVPTLLVFMYIIHLVFKNIFNNYWRVIRKTFLRFLVISMLISVLFSFIYAMIFTFELAHALELKSTTLSNITGFKFQGTTWFNFILEIFLFSCSIFFQFPSSVTFEGLSQIILIIQRVLGIMVPLVTVGYTFLEENKKNSGNAILYTFLNRGWNILRIRNSYSGSYKTLELIGPDLSINPILIEDQKSIREELDYFTLDWSTVDKYVLPYS
ncbi:hypothetical protein PTQ21_18660 [Paenibacillus marchantiae]|uniref:hypothetical protein n=1 Tax=Paenibacillus marchantiae TaxID=3026433 RepID=UPI00237BF138|nr:hypothetical protein [Paenibacillus marchantiae]WDQ30461.1 hypothetical protein PTQ21_18660 [Paenibacillus marchantiae]